MKKLAVLFYSIATFFMGFGFYKLFVYDNGELFGSSLKNAYVGGDAYNYIINACQSTAYFVLSLVFIVLGCFAIFMYNKNIVEPVQEIEPTTTEIVENNTTE